MQHMQMRMGLLLRHVTLLCTTFCKDVFRASVKYVRWSFLRKLSTLLFSLSYTYEMGGRFSGQIRCINTVLNFHFIFFQFFNIIVKYCLYHLLYLNCCNLFEEVFNPRIDKAIIIIYVILYYHTIYILSLDIYIKHLFMLSILFQSHMIRHSGTGLAFKNTHKTVGNSDTRALGGHSGT